MLSTLAVKKTSIFIWPVILTSSGTGLGHTSKIATQDITPSYWRLKPWGRFSSIATQIVLYSPGLMKIVRHSSVRTVEKISVFMHFLDCFIRFSFRLFFYKRLSDQFYMFCQYDIGPDILCFTTLHHSRQK